MRTALVPNSTLILSSEMAHSHTRTFLIQKCLGEGANCIAYQTTDENGLPFIVKECCPHTADRETNGAVSWAQFTDEAAAKSRFRAAYEIQRTLQNQPAFMNINTHLADGLYSANGTLYNITDVHNAKTYDQCADCSLQELFITIRSIARSVGVYHEHGYLHLDIKPENIMIYPETRDMVLLLDFDSVVLKVDLLNPETSVSYSNGYAAPELLQGKRGRLSEATDIYAIGALLYGRLFGRVPDSEDRRSFSDWALPEHPLFARMSGKVIRLTKELLRRTLSASPKNRYQSTSALISALDTLVKESDPLRRHLNSTCPAPMNYFVGREQELADIHSAFCAGSKTVFLFGMGGMGKTELALNYAQRHGAAYDVIAFGRYVDSIDALFRSDAFISIEGNSEGSLGLEAIRSLVDEHTLLIIDNFDVETDPSLEKLLSLDCKILITSRYDHSSYFPQAAHIQVGVLPDQAQYDIFVHEAAGSIDNEDNEAINGILQSVEGYTLALPLIAKQLKAGCFTAREMQERLKAIGIQATVETAVRHHKDQDVLGSAYSIICSVLDLSSFSESEKVVMGSISLLGDIVIERKELLSWIGKDYLDTVNDLVERSWVQIVGAGANAKLSLHKVIQEAYLSEMKPSTAVCEGLRQAIAVRAMEVANEHMSVRYDYFGGHMDTMMSGTEEYRYKSILRLMLEVFQNDDLSNDEVIFFWITCICCVANPIAGDIPEFRNFLENWVSRFRGKDSSMYPLEYIRANIALEVFALANGEDALNYVMEADLAITLFLSGRKFKKERIHHLLSLCLPVYQQMCIMCSPGDVTEYWTEIKAFDELSGIIRNLWGNALDEMEESKQKKALQRAYNDFCYRLTPEGRKWFSECDEVDESDLAEYEEDNKLDEDRRRKEIACEDGNIYVRATLTVASLCRITGMEYPTDIGLWVINGSPVWSQAKIDEVLPEIRELDKFSGVITPNVVGRTAFVVKLTCMEAGFSCAYALAGCDAECRQHLLNLLCYYEMMLQSRQGRVVASSQYSSGLPGAKTLLNGYGHMLPPDTALWFMDQFVALLEKHNKDNSYLNSGLFEVYEKAVELAEQSNSAASVAAYKKKIEEVSNIRFEY